MEFDDKLISVLDHLYGSVQDSGVSNAKALEILQSYIKSESVAKSNLIH